MYCKSNVICVCVHISVGSGLPSVLPGTISALHFNQKGIAVFLPASPSQCRVLQRWHWKTGMHRLLLECGWCEDTRVVGVTDSSHPRLGTHMPRTKAHRTQCARTNTALPVGKHWLFFPHFDSDTTPSSNTVTAANEKKAPPFIAPTCCV